MKLFLALLVLAITPVLVTARPAAPQTTNRASSHDRHHRKHSKGRHHHGQVSHHHSTHQAQ
jgi:hypothetical protein